MGRVVVLPVLDRPTIGTKVKNFKGLCKVDAFLMSKRAKRLAPTVKIDSFFWRGVVIDQGVSRPLLDVSA